MKPENETISVPTESRPTNALQECLEQLQKQWPYCEKSTIELAIRLASLPVGESRCTLTGHLCGTDTVQAGRGNCPDPANKYQCRGSESPEPVAYRVKDFGDGWILHYTLAAARDEADGVGNLIQPLYAHPQPLPKPPELGLGESREPLPNLPDQPSEPMSPASVRVVNSILEARVPESNFLRDEPELSSVPAEIENVSSDVPKSSNETRNI